MRTIGDEDSKSFKDILDAQPHENVTVIKKWYIDTFKNEWTLAFAIRKKKIPEENAKTGKL